MNTDISPALYDMHNHTSHSHDAHSDMRALCEEAIAKGLAGLAITEHCDIEFCKQKDELSPILTSFDEADILAGAFRGRLELLCGVEIGEGIWYPDDTATVIASRPFDAVLCSVHAVRYKNLDSPYSLIDFSKVSRSDILGFWCTYFEDLAEAAETQDYDILTHLSCPLRYLNGRYGARLSLDTHAPRIDNILKTVIRRGKSLEVNTSCLGTGYDALMPDTAVLTRYYALGGRAVTLGSDSHDVPNVGKGLETARNTLKAIGFEEAYFYRRRKPHAYRL